MNALQLTGVIMSAMVEPQLHSNAQVSQAFDIFKHVLLSINMLNTWRLEHFHLFDIYILQLTASMLNLLHMYRWQAVSQLMPRNGTTAALHLIRDAAEFRSL